MCYYYYKLKERDFTMKVQSINQNNYTNATKQQVGFSGGASFVNQANYDGKIVRELQLFVGKTVQSFADTFAGLGKIAEENGVDFKVTLEQVANRSAGWDEGMAKIKVVATTDEKAPLLLEGKTQNLPGTADATLIVRAHESHGRDMEMRERHATRSLCGETFSSIPPRDIGNEPIAPGELLGKLQQAAKRLAQKAKENLADAKAKMASFDPRKQ